MNGEKLLQAIGQVDDELIARAAKKERHYLLPWAAFAAMLVFVAGLSFLAFGDLLPFAGVEQPVEPPYSEAVLENLQIGLMMDYQALNSAYERETWEALFKYQEDLNIPCQYYAPTGDSTAERLDAMTQAVEDGCTVLLCNHYSYGGAMTEMAALNPDIKLVGIGVGLYDLYIEEGEAIPDNIYCLTYQEEYGGYLSGYTAVREGYETHGCYGQMSTFSVLHYVVGYLEGAQAAAREMEAEDRIQVRVEYGNQFYGGADLLEMSKLFQARDNDMLMLIGSGYLLEVAAEYPFATITTTNEPFAGGNSETQFYIQYDVDKTIDRIMEMLLTDEFPGGCAEKVPHYRLNDGAGTWSFSHTSREECQQVLQELIDGTRECSQAIEFDPEDYTIEVIFLGNSK